DPFIPSDLEGRGSVHDEAAASRLSLLLHLWAEVEARDAVGKAREVLDLLDVEHLAAHRPRINQRRANAMSTRDEARRQARQARADDHHVEGVFSHHWSVY